MDSRILFILNLIYVIIWQNFYPKRLNIVEIKMSTSRHQLSAMPIQGRIEVHYRFICSVLPTTMFNFHPVVLIWYTYQLCIFSNIVLVMTFVMLFCLRITPWTKYTNIMPYPYQQPRNWNVIYTVVRFMQWSSTTFQKDGSLRNLKHMYTIVAVQQKNAHHRRGYGPYLHVPHWLEFVYLDFQRPHSLFFTINLGACQQYSCDIQNSGLVVTADTWL